MAAVARRASDRTHLLLAEPQLDATRIVRRVRYLTSPLLLLSGWGWLELLRPLGVPGPRLVDALPLYEGSRRDTMPVATVVAIWIIVAALACLPFRPRRYPRLAAAMLGGAVFSIALVVQGAQLELARQANAGVDLGEGIRSSLPWFAGSVCSLVAAALWSRPNPADDERPTAVEAQ